MVSLDLVCAEVVFLIGILVLNYVCYLCLGKYKNIMVWERCIWSPESACSLADSGGLPVSVIVGIAWCFK